MSTSESWVVTRHAVYDNVYNEMDSPLFVASQWQLVLGAIETEINVTYDPMWLGKDFIFIHYFQYWTPKLSQIIFFALCFIEWAYSVSVIAMQILALNGNCLSWPWCWPSDNYVALDWPWKMFMSLVLALALRKMSWPWPWPRKPSPW